MASFPDNADYSDHYDFSDEIYTDQYKATINKVINLLGKKCFDLLKLSVVYKTSSADICRKMGFATENSVKTQKYKCKMKFLKILNENALFKEVLD